MPLHAVEDVRLRSETAARESSPARRRGGSPVARVPRRAGRHDATRSPRSYRGESTTSLRREVQTIGFPRPGPFACGDSWVDAPDERLARALNRFGALGANGVTHATPFDDDFFTPLSRVEHVSQALAYLRARIPLHMYI